MLKDAGDEPSSYAGAAAFVGDNHIAKVPNGGAIGNHSSNRHLLRAPVHAKAE